VPGSYLGCASGVSKSQFLTLYPELDLPGRLWLEQTDGVLFGVRADSENANLRKPALQYRQIADGNRSTQGRVEHIVRTQFE